MDEAIDWGSIAALNFMTLCIALLDGGIMPLATYPQEARPPHRSQGPLTVPHTLGPVLPSEGRTQQSPRARQPCGSESSTDG